jgi:hypothetical protein
MSSLPDRLTICKLNTETAIPIWATTGTFFAVTRTAEELSIVCEQSTVPADVQSEPGWRALKVEGPLDFGLTGILAGLATILAEAGISIFAISTFDTDYILVKAEKLSLAIEALQQAGHHYIET